MKRIIDIVLSFLALLTLIPLILMTAIAVRVSLGSPIFFRQMRPGLNGELFELVKFRTMIDLKDKNGEALQDAERLGRFGRLLRATSIDELPELWNVFSGDMSLVGPRPLLVEYLDLYTPEQSRRHQMRPGITGWAQINGRNALSWEEKFELDVWYVDNQSIWLDLKILSLTVVKVLRRDSVSQDGYATMQKFQGSK